MKMHIVFTDLDGTLLDYNTYSYEESLEGISILRKKNVPLVLVSSKTLSEMQKIHQELQLISPFIFENGGGIAYYPKDSLHYTKELIGLDVSLLKTNIHILRDIIKCPIKTILDMDVHEIMERTGLSRERAEFSQQRTTSLPFILLSENKIEIDELNKINRIVNKKGYTVTKGDRFFHFSSLKSNKGIAIKRIIDFYRKDEKIDSITSIGIGDSENDISMLQAVDMPFIVKKVNGTSIKTGLSNVQESKGIGPAGFTEIIKAIFTP